MLYRVVLISVVAILCGPLSLAHGAAAGPAQFQQISIFSTNGINSISIGDLNRDGLDDIACGYTDGRLFRYVQTSARGVFTDLQITSMPVNALQPLNVKVADVTGDGYNDIVIFRCAEGSIHREFSTGADTFSYALIDNWAGALVGPVICDVSQDNLNDIIMERTANGQIWIYRQNSSSPSGFSLVQGTTTFGAGVHALAAGHLDATKGPLLNDFVVGRINDGVLYAEFAKAATPSLTQTLKYLDTFNSAIDGVSGVTIMKVADLNGDGRMDILVVCADGKVFRENQVPLASRLFFRTQLWDFAQQVKAIAVDDLNHDGLNDMIVGLTDGTVSVLYQQDDGTFTNAIVASFTGETITTIDTGDLDNNGYRDFVVGLGSGAAYGFYQKACTPALSSDLNNDCKIDFSDFAIMASHWAECSLTNQGMCGN